jgi:beta-phosphoglucomutase-like phosphatase (HAD superfamily)
MVSPAITDTPSGSVSLVCCDLASIVVSDSVVERAFSEALATQGIVAGTEAYVRSMVRFDRLRGCPPADVMGELFAGDESRAQAASLAFDRSFTSAVERFGVAASPQALEGLRKIDAAGMRVCLLSSLSRAASEALLGGIRRQGNADLLLCAGDAPRGFPWPDPVLTAVLRLGVADVREVAMVSATESGLESGRRAGAGLVIGVTDDPERVPAMRKAGATDVLDDIAALPEFLAAGR